MRKNNKPNINYEIKGQDKTIQKLFGDKKVNNPNPNKTIKNNLGDNKWILGSLKLLK